MAFVKRSVVHQRGAPILELDGVSMCYDGVVAVSDVTFFLSSGERVAVVGPNGAGKSTLFKIIAGVLHPTAGEVKIAGHGPSGHICIAYVPQRSYVDWSFPVTVADVVMMGRIGKLGLRPWPRRSDWEFVHHCLDDVDLTDLSARQIGELSGGQQQRMFIARALAQEAGLMLMDEPLTGLDMAAQEDIFRLLDDLRRRQVTVLVATHDLNLAAERFDRVLLLNRRLLGLGLPEEVFTPHLLQMAYGGHLRLVQTDEGLMVMSDTCCGGDL